MRTVVTLLGLALLTLVVPLVGLFLLLAGFIAFTALEDHFSPNCLEAVQGEEHLSPDGRRAVWIVSRQCPRRIASKRYETRVMLRNQIDGRAITIVKYPHPGPTIAIHWRSADDLLIGRPAALPDLSQHRTEESSGLGDLSLLFVVYDPSRPASVPWWETVSPSVRRDSYERTGLQHDKSGLFRLAFQDVVLRANVTTGRVLASHMA